MDEKTKQIISYFPGLAKDPLFKITSPIDPNYNCIAWAYMYNNRWMQPPNGTPYLDGVTWWPDGIEEGMDIQCLVDAFSAIGYIRCNTHIHESGYIKIALYYNPNNNEWTHAARQRKEVDIWMSKLGQSYDIHHGTPYTIEGNNYGSVFCIMKKPSI